MRIDRLQKISSSRLQRPLSLMATAGLLSLSACGGGGGQSGPPPAPPVVPSTVNLTLKGQVIDAAIPNALVTVSVAGRSFTATADASGNYTVTMTLPPDAVGNVVTITAAGAAGQPNVVLTSTLGSFSALMTQAGSDATLTRDENNNTNVTNLTTAIDALVVAANGGVPVSNDQQLSDALKAIDADLALDIAAAIKLVIDGGVALPAGVSNTLQLATTSDARDSFIADQQANNATAFDQARSDTSNDPAITPVMTADQVPPRAYAILTATANPQDLYSSGAAPVEAFDFNRDGSGRYANGLASSTAMQWAIDGSGLITVSFTQSPSYSYVTFPIDPQTGQQVRVNCTDRLDSVKIKPLSSTSATVTDRYETTCDDTRFNRPAADYASTQAFVTPQQLTPLTRADVAGSTVTLSVYEPDTESPDMNLASTYDFVTFNTDGTGSTRLRGRTLTWSLNSDGAVEVDFSNGAHTTFSVIRSLSDLGTLVLADASTSAGQRRAVGSFAWDTDPAAAATTADVLGVYYQNGLGPSSFEGSDSRLRGFALEFTADGLLTQRSDSIVSDGNGGTVRTTSGQPNRTWGVHPDGSISAQLHYSFSAQRVAPDLCPEDTTSNDCLLLDQRDVFPANSDGKLQYVLERRRTDNANGVSANTPTTYLARFYEIAPNGDYAADRAPSGAGLTKSGRTSSQASRSKRLAPAS